MSHRIRHRLAQTALLAGAALAIWTSPAGALEPRQPATSLEAREFFLPELYISSSNAPLADVLGQLPNKGAWESFARERSAAGQDDVQVYIDPRSGAATNVMGSFPLIPGDGIGNRVTLGELGGKLGRQVGAVDAQTVAEAAYRFVGERKGLLGIDATQLGPVRATQVNPNLWQVSIPQVVNGVRVRDGRVALSISHGNVVTFGTEIWGNVTLRTRPTLSAEQALEAGFNYAGGRSFSDVLTEQPKLEIVPVAPQELQAGDAYIGAVGKGYTHRLVWTFVFERPPDGASWEAMVDAHSGDVVAFQDKNQYVTKQFTGGVYPLTDTGICPNNQTCGTMQTGWPMPFANTGLAAPNNFTNSAGNYNYPGGTATTTLSGQFVRMSDSCGALNASTTSGDLNLGGTNGQHDCTIGTGGGAGNTAASRSGFYELNKLVEQAQGWLPTNTWLQSQLTANMNIALTCNAFWNGATVNFYRSGGGCRNTGEIAAVFDHEWGHGLDDNDAAGVLSNSSEAYADVAAIYRLQASCVGFGFFDTTTTNACGTTADGTGKNQNESQTGTHCDTNCSGVRDADWAFHADNTPDTALGFVCTHCSASTGPCGKQVHCAAAPVRQAAWDLVTRDLTVAPFSYNSQTAFMVGNKIFYQGSGNIGTWHACTCGSSSDGCATANGYIQWLTADDDNGNLADGTPHMTAIFNAFNRHGIACSTPTPVNSGCAAGPTGAATLTTTAGDTAASLSWGAVSGASKYWVLRTEGHAGCDFGKAKIAEVTGTTYTDTQVANGRLYSYNVVAQGASAACYGPVSNCSQVTPTASVTPDFSVSCSPASLSALQGGSATSTCTVTSTNGFNAAVALDCTGQPVGVTCSYSPASVTPPANGSTTSTLTVSVAGSTATGTYNFSARGTNGATVRTSAIALTVTSAPTPNFSIACSPSSLNANQGASATSTCTVTSTNGFASAVALSCTGLPAGASCAFAPASVTPPANGSITSALTVSVLTTATPGTYAFSVQGVSGALTRTAAMSLTVNPPAGSNQVLTFSSTPALAIPDNNTTGVTSTINVANSITITSVSVNVGITHTYQGDLEVALIGPDNTTVLLHNRTGAGTDNINTTYNITTRSNQVLTAFNGKNTSGAWKLRVRDLAAADTGTLNSWKLTFNGYYTLTAATAIPDNNTTGITSTINVPATGTIVSLRVRVDITHTYQGDLEVSLIGPDNTTVLLHNRTGGTTDNIQTVYPDLTAPAAALTAFNGKAINGAWKLKVRDLAAADTGTLNSWEIDFRTN